jgi:hypothetical protein
MKATARGVIERSPEIIFTLCLLLAAAFLLAAGEGLTFFFDEWDLLLNRDGLSPDVLFRPHNGQVFVLPVLVYKTVGAILGFGSQLPFRVLATMVITLCSILVFVYARRRAGTWMALMVTVPVLCVGAGWEALLLPLSINFTIGLAAGMAMLLALERGDIRGDVVAAMLLTVAIAAGGIGLAFAAGAVVDLVARRDPRRAWIVILPVSALLAWTLAYGEEGTSLISTERFGEIGANLFTSLSHGLNALAGFSLERRPYFWLGTEQQPALVLGVLFLVGLAIRVGYTKVPITSRSFQVGAVLLTFWLLIAAIEGREPESSRYQYPGALLLVAFTVSLLEGIRLPRRLPLMLVPLVALSVWSSSIALRDGRAFLKEQTEVTLSAIGTIEAENARDLPSMRMSAPGGDFRFLALIDVGAYFRLLDRGEEPLGYTEERIEAAPDSARRVARRIRNRIEADRRRLEYEAGPDGRPLLPPAR